MAEAMLVLENIPPAFEMWLWVLGHRPATLRYNCYEKLTTWARASQSLTESLCLSQSLCLCLNSLVVCHLATPHITVKANPSQAFPGSCSPEVQSHVALSYGFASYLVPHCKSHLSLRAPTTHIKVDEEPTPYIKVDVCLFTLWNTNNAVHPSICWRFITGLPLQWGPMRWK